MSLVFDNICHSFGDAPVLQDVSLEARAGEILCLLGPSGCGKTTLLNLAAGILDVQAGEIGLDGQELASSRRSPPPEERPVGLVFQEGALFPHLSVAQNIEFGVSKRADRREISAALLDQIGLTEFAKRYPLTLSGGQQQRVAVARALAPQPRVILMDEPFANIDITLRKRLREEIRQMLKAADCITIMVTHDPEEAMEISDRLAIMLGGRIAQVGRPKAIYDRPASVEVAALTSEGTRLSARLEGGSLSTAFGEWPLSSLDQTALPHSPDEIDLFVRPFSVRVTQAPQVESAPTLIDIRHTGQAQIVTLQSADQKVASFHVDKEHTLQLGMRVKLEPSTGSLIGFAR